MIASITPRLGLTRTATSRASGPARCSCSMVERLEPRQLFSAAPAVSIPTDAIVPAVALHHRLHHGPKSVQTTFPMSISNLALQNGQLVASGTVAGIPFTTPATLTVDNPTGAAGTLAPAATTVPILHLTLAPIHLNLLGLLVDTSPICLKIDANTGPGNLLGNLLAGVANLLNGGTPLGTILGGLTSTDLNSVLGGLTGLLNGALGQVGTATRGGAPAAPATPPAVNILHLSLGPLNLNLLGLAVNLDNCSGGPVTIDLSAQPGPGNLLGNLLAGVAGLLNGGLPLGL